MIACRRQSWISSPRMPRKRRASSLARSDTRMQGAMRPLTGSHCLLVSRRAPRATITAACPAAHDDHDPFRAIAASAACRGLTRTRRPKPRCTMRFGVFLPPQAHARRVPVLYWLSGLTCTEENFIVKAGAQRVAAALGHRARRAGYQPARPRHSGRSRELRFWPRRRFLCRCHRGAVVAWLPDVFLRGAGIARRRRRRAFPSIRRAPESSAIRWAGMAR